MALSSKLLLFASLFSLLWHPWLVSEAVAEIETEVLTTLNLDKAPLDVVTSADGKVLFVLTQGEVLVYTQSGGTLSGRVTVDEGANQIAVSPRGDQLYLTNGQTKSLTVVNVAFIQSIDIAGAPFKGPAAAPVVIAVFDDYQ